MDEAASVADWKGLLARCHQWGRDRAEWERRQGREVTSAWMPSAFAPATEDQIAREEARLGVRLPPSLRSFYLQTNGHGVVGNAIWAVRSVEQIGWMRDVEPYLYEILFEDDPAVARCLVVSGEADASWWLLDPGEVDGRGEWRAGRWSSWNPGMDWIAADFFCLFQSEVASAERLLERKKSPPAPPGTGRPRSERSIGDPHGPVVHVRPVTPSGYTYVPAEGFASVVTILAPSTAKVGEWVPLHATRRSGPWNLVRREEVRPEEMNMPDPKTVEWGVASNLSWNVDPPGIAEFHTNPISGAHPDARWVVFPEPGVYTLQGSSAYPLPVKSNVITVRVE